jgi:hypothetical protein
VANLGESTPGAALTPEVQSAITGIVKASLDAALSPVVDRMNKQSGIIEKLRRGRTGEDDEPQAEQPQQRQPAGLEARLKALEEREAKATARESAMVLKQTTAGLARALARAGVPAIQAEDLADVLVGKNPDKFALDEAGDLRVKEGDDEALPAAAWAGLYLATERGKAYLPAQQNPKIGDHGRGPVTVPTRTVTKEQLERGEVNAADLLAGKVALAD